MPCRDETHTHNWPTEGTIEICKCEIFCGYCTGDAAKVVYEHPWQLRGHIREHAQKEGLAIKVSPQPPKTHVNTTSTKRKLTEVESSENEAEEDSDEVQDDPTKDEDYEDGTKKGKSKAKPRSSTNKSNPSAGPDDEYIDPSQGPLRLRAKPAAKAKKDSIKSHAASFQPVGPKTGPPSPKRTKQTPVMGPPASLPMNNLPRLAPNMPPSLARLDYLQRLGNSRAVSAPLNLNNQGFSGHPQQNANNAQRPVGNMGFPTNNMGPRPGGMDPRFGGMGPSSGNMDSLADPFPGNMGPRPISMGPFPGKMGFPPGSMGPTSGNMGRPAGNTGPPMGNTGFSSGSNMRPRLDSMEISPRTKIPPRVNMGPQPGIMGPPMNNMRPPMSNMGPPMNPQPRTIMPNNQNFGRINPTPNRPPGQFLTPHQRIRQFSTSLLTQNLTEASLITLYQDEIEKLRGLQIKRSLSAFRNQVFASVMQQVQSQWTQQQCGQVRGLHPVRMGVQQVGMQGRQMGGLQPGSRAPLGVQQPGQRVPPGVPQPGQYVAVQQSAAQQPPAERAAPAVVDPVLPPQQAPSSGEKPVSQ